MLMGLLVFMLASRAGLTQLPFFQFSGKMFAVLLVLLLVRRVSGKW